MSEGNPRFRRDLTTTGISADGVAYVEVSDSRSGNSFRFYDFEHAVAIALDGRSLPDVVAGLQQSAGLDFTVEQLAAFSDRLGELGFLEEGRERPDEMVTPVHVLPIETNPQSADSARSRGGATSVPVPVAAAASPFQSGFSSDATVISGPENDATEMRASPFFAPQEPTRVGPAAKKPIFAAPAEPLQIDTPQIDAPSSPAAPDEGSASWMSEVSSLHSGDSGVMKMPAPPMTGAPGAAVGRPAVKGAGPMLSIVPPVAGAKTSGAGQPGAPVSLKGGSSAGVYVVIALVVAALLAFIFLRGSFYPEAPPVPVRTLSPSPASAYQWFETPGALVDTTADTAQVGLTRAAFDLTADEALAAHRLAFCHVLVSGHAVPCVFADDAQGGNHVAVDLPAGSKFDRGSAVSLAKARFDDVYTVPASAVLRVGRTQRLLVVGPTGRAESRGVSLAADIDTESGVALISQGIDPGDAIIIDVPADLRAHARVILAENRLP